jgi:tetratricopeptide (TPR) repeat protein
MSEMSPADKFPDMKPTSPPSLHTVNGFGTSIYGRRDYDAETHTYVKSHCVTALFIPMVWLGAYRVADAPNGGWYFIGRVPLSAVARGWNILLLGLICIGAGLGIWLWRAQSPEVQAAQKLKEADEMAASGDVLKAARTYRDLARGHTSQARTALNRFKDLFNREEAKASPEVALEMCALARELDAVPDLYERGLKLAKALGDAHPRAALSVLKTITPLAKDPADVTPERQKLLEQLVKKEPNDPEPASDLAVILEGKHQLDKCEALLAPHAKRLGTLEGARILGQIYAHQNKLEQAHALLVPYMEKRLQALHAAEEHYSTTVSNAQKAIVDRLQGEAPPDFPLEEYKGADKTEQQRIFVDYVNKKLKEDPAIQSAREQLVKEARIVPAALDLGMVLLRRAQPLGDSRERSEGLAQAEKVFLAIRGVSQESNLHLGQVYYWLGKHAEAKKLFDKILADNQRSSEMLMAVAQMLREVGSVTEARSLLQEAYDKEKDAHKQQQIANLRSVMFIDLDDEITWLRRANSGDPQTRASLSRSLALKAMEEGKDEEAARQLREALAIYATMPLDEATLNNSGLVYLSLYGVTGDQKALDEGIERIEKAIALRPSDSILLGNGAGIIEDAAFRDIIGAAIDFKALKSRAGLSLLSFLYVDQKGRDTYVQRVREDKKLAKATGYYEKLLVLAPKRSHAYSELSAIHSYTRDLASLQLLAKRLAENELDVSNSTRLALDYYRRKNDEKLKKV